MRERPVMPNAPTSRRARTRRIVLVAVVVYLAVAYLLLPELWIRHEHHQTFAGLPMRTLTGDGIPGDPVNVALIGNEPELVGAFERAGWSRAAELGLRSDVEIGASVLLRRPDPNAPVSKLYLFGRKEDVAFEKEVGRSAKQRNHVRFWRVELARDPSDRPLWLGAATFDRGVGLSHRTGQITHHIAADIDVERDHVIDDLAAAGQVDVEYRVAGIGPTLDGRNGGGDRFFTDGEIAVGVLTRDNQVRNGLPEMLSSPPTMVLQDWLFAQTRPFLGSMVGDTDYEPSAPAAAPARDGAAPQSRALPSADPAEKP